MNLALFFISLQYLLDKAEWVSRQIVRIVSRCVRVTGGANVKTLQTNNIREIITSTSPIIALSMVGRLPLLWELFDKVYVPKTVIHELTSSAHESDYGRKEILEVIKEEKVIAYSVKDELLVHRMYGKLHNGELETIIGGKELDVDFVLIDEKAARNMAKTFFLTPIGSLGILRLAKT